MTENKRANGGITPYDQISFGLSVNAPSVHRVLLVDQNDFDRLTVYHRGPSDVLAVLKRLNGAGAPEVAFGNGHDFVSALLALEGSLRAGKWRKDKPAPSKRSAQ